MSSVRIISDGTPMGSRVEVDGVALDYVQRVTFDLTVDHVVAAVTLTILKPEIDLRLEDWELVKRESAVSRGTANE